MKLSSRFPGPPCWGAMDSHEGAILTIVLRVLLSKKESLSDRSNLLKFWEQKETQLTGVSAPGFRGLGGPHYPRER